jgi:ABC-type multidrug transport system ATPase subunit
VNNVLSLLDLEKVRHDRIGDASQRGISGGQRKRVNIGSELVADPWMLFLDEPTSGLDSSSAHKVVEILRKLADLGLTVVCVLHQPRKSIFELIDDVLLLGNGGRLVYSGPRKKATKYFNTVGFEMPDDMMNPADWLTDVVAGEVRNRVHKSLMGAVDLQELWLAARQARLNRLSGATSFSDPSDVTDEVEQRLMKQGMNITKHPRFGLPEKRQLFLRKQDGETFIVWSSTKSDKTGLLSFGWSMMSQTLDGQRMESLNNVEELREGITTNVLERTAVPSRSHLYLSIILKSRTLDLECDSEEERDDLMLCMQHHLRAINKGQNRFIPNQSTTVPIFSKTSSMDVDSIDENDVEIGQNMNPMRKTIDGSFAPRAGGLETVASEAEVSA